MSNEEDKATKEAEAYEARMKEAAAEREAQADSRRSETERLLREVQHELKAPKGKYNAFGRYRYRSAETILEAVKPLLHAHGLTLTLSDAVQMCGDRHYVVARANLRGPNGGSVGATGWAREPNEKKGMDEAQITGMASSYARKYALNGLFCIDETEADPDAAPAAAQKPDATTAQKPAQKPSGASAHSAAAMAQTAKPNAQTAAQKPAVAKPRAKAKPSAMAVTAWRTYRQATPDMDERMRNERFRAEVKALTGKTDSADVTDAEWEEVVREITAGMAEDGRAPDPEPEADRSAAETKDI